MGPDVEMNDKEFDLHLKVAQDKEQIAELKQQCDELLAALDSVLDAVGAITKPYELQGYGMSEQEIEKIFAVRDTVIAKVKEQK